MAHLRIWAREWRGFVIFVGPALAVVVWLSCRVSPWFLLVLLFPVPFSNLHRFIAGILQPLFVGKRHMEIAIEDDRLGYYQSGRYEWLSLDRICGIDRFSKDAWTIGTHDGVVITIPVSAIEQKIIDHVRSAMEYWQTPEGQHIIAERTRQEMDQMNAKMSRKGKAT
jgi:hypothetical protein